MLIILQITRIYYSPICLPCFSCYKGRKKVSVIPPVVNPKEHWKTALNSGGSLITRITGRRLAVCYD